MAELVWVEGRTECGRFSIQGETIRGEGRWWHLLIEDVVCESIAEDWDLELGALGDRRKLKRIAQRLSDAAEKLVRDA